MGLWAVILAFLALGRSLCSPGCRYTEDCASSDVFVCDGCLDGFFEAAGLCLACSTVAEHCAACTLGTSGSVVCTLCEEGFGLSSGACESESETLGVASAAELSTFGVDLDEQRRGSMQQHFFFFFLSMPSGLLSLLQLFQLARFQLKHIFH
eukprot:TRINITY_DN4156_c0_g1_i6.p1 TRINITY_DN4156_c0_g1~~TRINITY_DN4156_c0_g1_i6.p1  ORF type:complete len:152 (+),score=31.13 TRINITY_DN4156_c0_g1_i6:1-456(+)